MTMAHTILNRYFSRKDFAKIRKVMEIPNLLDMQKRSYDRFLQRHDKPEERGTFGLHGVFKSVFPIKDFSESASLEYVKYSLGEPKYDVDECRQKELTYAVPLKVLLRLVVWDVNPETGARNIRDVKEQEVYFGEVPLMTEGGTFIINGTERVIVSQLHRSPGVFFNHDKGKASSGGKLLFYARLIPNRGSWIDFEFDTKDIIYVRIDRKRKFLAAVVLKALGYSEKELLDYFYESEKITFKENKIFKHLRKNLQVGDRATEDIVDIKTDKVIIKKDKRIKEVTIQKIKEANLQYIPISIRDLEGKFVSHDIVDPHTGEMILKCNEELTYEKIKMLRERKIEEFEILFIDDLTVDSSFRNTLALDKVKTQEETVIEIYRRLRPHDPPTKESAHLFFERLFFNPDYYDLGNVGRLKLNYKLNLDIPLEVQVLRKEDIMETVRYLLKLKCGKGEVDDIDHLGNRRVRTVAELIENQYRIGLVRMEKAIKERMSLQDVETLMPHDLVNAKLVSAVINEFFGSSQLSQFMDQTNPLSEITHKRRLSALGPGGLTRERAGFEVRDVHPTHYGRICPIETPEGPNIGLISSLSTYARINEFSFIETPYRKVVKGVVTNEIQYLSALDEKDHAIAQANAALDSKGRFVNPLVSARRGGEFVMVKPEEVAYMDVSPKQLVSVAASLIPFLENDDANRALMGSNMQRQAVSLMKTESPLVGTGMEGIIARDSGVTVIAHKDGTVVSVDAERIVVRSDQGAEGEGDRGISIYNLIKFRRSNQNTCINQKPIVYLGERVKKGDVIADGPATDRGELALGRNMLVAFLPWGGYNFEDSILLSEKVVSDDYFTSIHIEEFEVLARDTKLGKEEITRDIPGLGEEALKDLDDSGIIRSGAEVKPNDILVGKITPKGETQLSPEEKLLRAIFGEKARDVQDTSLRIPPGIEGTVIGVRIFSRKGVEKDERSKAIENEQLSKVLRDQEVKIKVLKERADEKIKNLLVGKVSAKRLTDKRTNTVVLGKNEKITADVLSEIPSSKWKDIVIENRAVEEKINKIREELEEQIKATKTIFTEKMERLKSGDELPPGVIKMVKIDLAVKRKLEVGDKMAGRHGNKGVLSRILPEEDMPYMEDGTPVDIVLNPLGVPSRMNVGQILETHLGWASLGLGRKINELLEKDFSINALRSKIKNTFDEREISQLIDESSDEEILALARSLSKGVRFSSPVFDGANEEQITNYLKTAGLPETGQTTLYDGRSGEPFDNKVTVGIIYMMKLHHLVSDKIHARSIGTYSLVTQQPLGGKAQFGGQRLGEMEVWALQAYGAAYTLQEFLTVKSDDVQGRTKLYENIVKGDHDTTAGLPESFNVLVKELQSLCLNVKFIENESKN
jgi:DNA-directed RNA polymerase subunit beta